MRKYLSVLGLTTILASGLAYGQSTAGVGSGPVAICLNDISYRAFAFFWGQTNPNTGLTKDRAWATGGDSYTVASIASTGFGLTADVLAMKRGWITPAQAYARANLALTYLDQHGANQRGWFYHFVDWNTGARVWNSEASSIDTAILLAGVITCQQTWPTDASITTAANDIINRIDWNWMLTNGGALPTSLTFCMGWTPESGFLPYRWDTCDEQLMLNIMALGASTAVPTATWTAINRPLVNYGPYQTIVGGPLFMHELSHCFLDFYQTRDSLGFDYWIASRQEVLAQKLYSTNNPSRYVGYSANVWGLSACDGPKGYAAYGAPGNVVDDGTIAASDTVGAVMFDPADTIPAVLAMSSIPGVYRPYGFVSGFNQTANWVDTDVVGYDLGIAMAGIENSRDNVLHNTFMSSPMIQRGWLRAGLHITNEGNPLNRALKSP